MKKEIREKIVEEKLKSFIRRFGWLDVSSQVSYTRKKIDLVVKSNLLNEVWAIEVKVKDWKTALRQARLNSSACNLSYVAIWHKYANAPLRNRHLFEELGIGLIVIDGNFSPSIKVVPSEIIYNNQACESIKRLI